MKDYGRLEFRFKKNKAAYLFARWISIGKELGFVPDVEVILADKVVWVGWYLLKEPKQIKQTKPTKSQIKKDDESYGYG